MGSISNSFCKSIEKKQKNDVCFWIQMSFPLSMIKRIILINSFRGRDETSFFFHCKETQSPVCAVSLIHLSITNYGAIISASNNVYRVESNVWFILFDLTSPSLSSFVIASPMGNQLKTVTLSLLGHKWLRKKKTETFQWLIVPMCRALFRTNIHRQLIILM